MSFKSNSLLKLLFHHGEPPAARRVISFHYPQHQALPGGSYPQASGNRLCGEFLTVSQVYESIIWLRVLSLPPVHHALASPSLAAWRQGPTRRVHLVNLQRVPAPPWPLPPPWPPPWIASIATASSSQDQTLTRTWYCPMMSWYCLWPHHPRPFCACLRLATRLPSSLHQHATPPPLQCYWPNLKWYGTQVSGKLQVAYASGDCTGHILRLAGRASKSCQRLFFQKPIIVRIDCELNPVTMPVTRQAKAKASSLMAATKASSARVASASPTAEPPATTSGRFDKPKVSAEEATSPRKFHITVDSKPAALIEASNSFTSNKPLSDLRSRADQPSNGGATVVLLPMGIPIMSSPKNSSKLQL